MMTLHFTGLQVEYLMYSLPSSYFKSLSDSMPGSPPREANKKGRKFTLFIPGQRIKNNSSNRFKHSWILSEASFPVSGIASSLVSLMFFSQHFPELCFLLQEPQSAYVLGTHFFAHLCVGTQICFNFD